MASRALWQSAADSQSLWNFTLSPGKQCSFSFFVQSPKNNIIQTSDGPFDIGWSQEEANVLRFAVMKYGCGNWKQIMKHFPAKTCGQLNLQTQRLFGQQSLAALIQIMSHRNISCILRTEFYKLHIDPRCIKEKNDQVEHVQRKNGCIINTGDNITAEQKMERRNQNKALFTRKHMQNTLKRVFFSLESSSPLLKKKKK
ncbi:hypothetical protein RFI_14517 [Reticulomyxa filosa]|uniref:Myb-like domain-containing protein n=1 Tax=Reticulomyxa filosa TaxID=46433 RepID=X6N9E0_RETFI|nr:hypothetical protein RFI_14517 [Reticulomyxa filosa]|eukprot:ETO22676.1 hypothetical protein RFI_14517 [Reticulomyxa filosa]